MVIEMATKKGEVRKTSRRAYSPKRRGGHKSKPKIHVVPDILYLASATVLLGPAITNEIGQFRNNSGTLSDKIGAVAENIVPNLTDNVIPNVIPAVELAIIGKVISWGGKKLGLNKLGTKEVKVA